MPDFDYDLNLDTLGSSSHGLADNDSFEPNGHETTELNTHNPNSPPPDSLPLNTLPPDSQFPIPPTPSIIVKVEKHPCSAHHQHLLQRTTDQPVSTGHYPLSVKPFRPFTSLQDYTFADVLIRAHTGAKSIDQLLSTYPPGHLSFKSHKDVFNIVDQASRVAPMVSSPFFPFSFFFLPILFTHHPFWLVRTSQC